MIFCVYKLVVNALKAIFGHFLSFFSFPTEFFDSLRDVSIIRGMSYRGMREGGRVCLPLSSLMRCLLMRRPKEKKFPLWWSIRLISLQSVNTNVSLAPSQHAHQGRVEMEIPTERGEKITSADIGGSFVVQISAALSTRVKKQHWSFSPSIVWLEDRQTDNNAAWRTINNKEQQPQHFMGFDWRWKRGSRRKKYSDPVTFLPLIPDIETDADAIRIHIRWFGYFFRAPTTNPLYHGPWTPQSTATERLIVSFPFTLCVCL